MRTVFKIDNQEFDVIVSDITRSFIVQDTPNTTRRANLDMYREIIGTFYNYSITLSSNNLKASDYDALYEIISAPKDFHNIELPYGQAVLSFSGYVTQGKDQLSSMLGGNKWGKLTFNIIAKEPQRRVA